MCEGISCPSSLSGLVILLDKLAADSLIQLLDTRQPTERGRST